MNICTDKLISLFQESFFLTLNVSDGETNRLHHFHYIWLRHHCPCCIHAQTKERIISPSSIDMDIIPKEVIAQKDVIKIIWEQDHHTSIYSLEWLIKHTYASEDKSSWINGMSLSDVSLKQGPVSKAMELVNQYGFAVIKQYGLDTEKFIQDMLLEGLEVTPTHFGRYEDLKKNNTTNQNTDQLGYTDSAVDLHTDQPFIANAPRYQALHCIQKADAGGESIISDGVKAALRLKEMDIDSFQILSEQPISFDRKQQHFKSCVYFPMIEYDGNTIKQIRHSYFSMGVIDFPFSQIIPFYRAYQQFDQLIKSPQNAKAFLLESEDILIYDNHRMLHARTKFEGERWVRGIYFDKK